MVVCYLEWQLDVVVQDVVDYNSVSDDSEKGQKNCSQEVHASIDESRGDEIARL